MQSTDPETLFPGGGIARHISHTLGLWYHKVWVWGR